MSCSVESWVGYYQVQNTCKVGSGTLDIDVRKIFLVRFSGVSGPFACWNKSSFMCITVKYKTFQKSRINRMKDGKKKKEKKTRRSCTPRSPSYGYPRAGASGKERKKKSGAWGKSRVSAQRRDGRSQSRKGFQGLFFSYSKKKARL